MKLLAFVVLALAASGLTGCRQLGFTNRVLWRVPSPDGRVVAVCQEIPVLDGPDFDIRLEQPNGTLRQRLYRIGDGDPCTEVAWAPDGRTLAVLSGHVARIRFVDVEGALKSSLAPAPWRQVDLSTERDLRLGRNLRFVGPLDVEVTTCSVQPRGDSAEPQDVVHHPGNSAAAARSDDQHDRSQVVICAISTVALVKRR